MNEATARPLVEADLAARLAAHAARPHSGACKACRIITGCLGAADAGRLAAFNMDEARRTGMYTHVVFRREHGAHVTAKVCMVCRAWAAVVRVQGGPSKRDYWLPATTAVSAHSAMHAAEDKVRVPRLRTVYGPCTRWT